MTQDNFLQQATLLHQAANYMADLSRLLKRPHADELAALAAAAQRLHEYLQEQPADRRDFEAAARLVSGVADCLRGIPPVLDTPAIHGLWSQHWQVTAALLALAPSGRSTAP